MRGVAQDGREASAPTNQTFPLGVRPTPLASPRLLPWARDFASLDKGNEANNKHQVFRGDWEVNPLGA